MGRKPQATERILAIRRVEAAIREKTRDLKPPRTLVVATAGSLVYCRPR